MDSLLATLYMSEDERLSAFLESYPTSLHYCKPESRDGLWVFWSEDEQGSEISSSSSAEVLPPMLQHHIKSAFSKLKAYYGHLVVQLWAPVTLGDRRLLSTSAQPFAIGDLLLDENLQKYRLRSLEYQYNIDANNHQLQEEENPIILCGGPAAAFLNRMTEFAYLKGHQGSPLARYALEECRLNTSIMLPICSPSQTSSSCVAVVECTSHYFHRFEIIREMTKILEEAGLIICPIQERIPYKTIDGLKPARDDIEAALKIVCGSHNLDVAQVWIHYDDKNHEPFSSSMEGTRTKHLMALKLTGYLKKDTILIHDGAEDYCNICDVFPLEAGKELVGKTLQDYKPRFCKSINKLRDGTLLANAFNRKIRASGVAICLRSIDTGDLDYAFEFIWYHRSNYVILLETLLLTLKSCLPCFKFASGAELGDKLQLLVNNDFSNRLELHSDAETFITESEIESFMIFRLPRMLQDHIKCAFSNLNDFYGTVIVQLWTPVTFRGRYLLSTSGQPFALMGPDKDNLKKYRLHCMEHHYNIHVTNQQLDIQQEEENPMILNGGPAAAFLNRMTEFTHLKDHQESPLARYALKDCRLKTSIMLPICRPSQTSSCIAVVECTFERSCDINIMKEMKNLLEEVGLSICPVQEHIPYKTIYGLKPARDDVEAALKIVCQAHSLDFAQVWIAYSDENHVPCFSSSRQTKRIVALKLTGYLNKDFNDSMYAKSYNDICDVVKLETREELVWKTLQDYKPRICKNAEELETTLLSSSFSEEYNLKTSHLAVCMRSVDTGDLDYAFEFIWSRTSDYVILLDKMLLTLKRCLPCFKLASGAELESELELLVIDDYLNGDAEISEELESHSDAEDIIESEMASVKIFQRKNSSPLPIALETGEKLMIVDSCKAKWKTAPKELSKEDIEKQFGNTMKEAAGNLKVSLSTLKRKCKAFGIMEWQGRPNVIKKRKVNASSSNESNRNEKDHGAIQDVNRTENTLTIKAEYEGDMIKVKLHISEATFVNVEKEIGKKLNLTHGTYKLKYLDKDVDLILLTSDQDMSDCIENFMKLGQPMVRLLVLL